MIPTVFNLLRRGAVAAALLGSAAGLLANDIRSYGVARAHIYSQDSASAPSQGFFPWEFVASFDGKSASIQDATVSTPSQTFSSIPLDTTSDQYLFEYPGQTLADTVQFFPDGTYSIEINSDNDGTSNGSLTLASTPFPTAIPQVLNYDAAQSVNAANDFTLNFNAFTGAGANDKYQLQVLDGDTVVFDTTGTGTSAVIPAGYLQPDYGYTGKLRFVHYLKVDTTSIPGATGTSALYNETQFSISTAGDGGTTGGSTGGTTGSTTGGGTAPTLVASVPANLATGVAANTTVIFSFSTQMAPTQSIQWSPNVNSSRFSYTWLGGQALMVTATGGFPAGETVTWTLNPVPGAPNNFRSTGGAELASGVTGSFTVAGSGGSTGGSTGGTTGGVTGGTTGDCTSTNAPDSGIGFGFTMKELNYVQNSDAAPVLDAENAGMFVANYASASNQTVTAVTLTGPKGAIALSNLFGSFIAFGNVSSAAALDADYPAGNYTFNATGAGSGAVTLGTPTTIPVPHFLNLTALTNMNVTQPFVLRWDPFTGATANDSISLEISADNNGGDFHAPDYCLNIPLTNTDTQITIPANTFKAGHKYSGSLTFARRLTFNTNTIPNTVLMSQNLAQTTFDFTGTSGGGGTGNPPQWLGGIVRNPDGTVTISVQADAGTTLVIERSTTLNGDWTQETLLPVITGSAQFTFNPKTSAKAFYRARIQ